MRLDRPTTRATLPSSEPSLEVLASGGSDLDSGGAPPRQWRQSKAAKGLLSAGSSPSPREDPTAQPALGCPDGPAIGTLPLPTPSLSHQGGRLQEEGAPRQWRPPNAAKGLLSAGHSPLPGEDPAAQPAPLPASGSADPELALGCPDGSTIGTLPLPTPSLPRQGGRLQEEGAGARGAHAPATCPQTLATPPAPPTRALQSGGQASGGSLATGSWPCQLPPAGLFMQTGLTAPHPLGAPPAMPTGLTAPHTLGAPPAVPVPPVRAPQLWAEGLPDDMPLAHGLFSLHGASSSYSEEGPPPTKRKKKQAKKASEKPSLQTKAKSKAKAKARAKGKSKPHAKPAQALPESSDSALIKLLSAVATQQGWFAARPAHQGFAPVAPTTPLAPPAERRPPIPAPPAVPTTPLAQPAERHAWLPPPPPVPTTPLDPPAERRPRMYPPARAPAALGAPPGEETLHTWERPLPQSAPGTSPRESGSDWGSMPQSAFTDSDIISVTSGAPSTRDLEPPSGLRHLSEEAQALLLRYLGEFYTTKTEETAQQAQPSLLFRAGSEPAADIPLTADFRQEYERIAAEAPARGTAAPLRRAFLFREEDTKKFLAAEQLSPELLALGEHLAAGNPLKRRQYTDEDRRWESMAVFCRYSMRLAAYAGALSNLAVQADQLGVSPEDRALLSSLLLSITELLWKQSTRAAFMTTRRRRDLALSALGFSNPQRAQLTRDMPFMGPYLFSGQFTPRLKEELAARQQARELASQLRKSRPSARPRGGPRPPYRAPPPPVRQGGTQPPAHQRGRGARSSRGRSRKGRYGGQRGHSQAAPSRGGF